jgi:predicted nucleic acid-binding protein
MVFIYWLEDHPDYAPRVSEILDAINKRGDTLCTSFFTLGEVLAGPYRQSADEVVAQIRNTMRPPAVEFVPFNAETSDLYARIRARNRVAPANAIHLASAAQAGANLFLTNDKALHGLVIPGIDFIAGLNVNVF